MNTCFTAISHTCYGSRVLLPSFRSYLLRVSTCIFCYVHVSNSIRIHVLQWYTRYLIDYKHICVIAQTYKWYIFTIFTKHNPNKQIQILDGKWLEFVCFGSLFHQNEWEIYFNSHFLFAFLYFFKSLILFTIYICYILS